MGEASTGQRGVDAAQTSPSSSRAVRVLRSPWTRISLLVLLVAVGVTLATTADDLSVEGIRATVDGVGPLAPLAYVLLYTVAAVLLLPGTPFTVTAGVVFGPALGLVVALAGATMGATGSFLVGRAVGRDAVAELAGDRVQRIDQALARRGFVAVLIVRLIPLFPFNVLNLVCGVTALRLRDYVLGTAIGIVPGSALLAVAGGSIDDPTSPVFIGSVTGFIVLAVVTGLIARRLRPEDVAGSDGPGRA